MTTEFRDLLHESDSTPEKQNRNPSSFDYSAFARAHTRPHEQL